MSADSQGRRRARAGRRATCSQEEGLSAPVGGLRGGSLAQRIGRRLRARRQELGFTLAKAAELASVSTSYLSAVENGVNLPSLPTLARITEAVGTTIPAVLAEEGANFVRRERLPVPRQGTRELSHAELQLQAIAVASLPRREMALPLPTKDHDVFCYVIDGELRVCFDDAEPVALRAGDALDLRSASSVVFASRTRALSVWTSCPIRV